MSEKERQPSSPEWPVPRLEMNLSPEISTVSMSCNSSLAPLENKMVTLGSSWLGTISKDVLLSITKSPALRVCFPARKLRMISLSPARIFPCTYSLIVRQGSPEGQLGLGEWGVT